MMMQVSVTARQLVIYRSLLLRTTLNLLPRKRPFLSQHTNAHSRFSVENCHRTYSRRLLWWDIDTLFLTFSWFWFYVIAHLQIWWSLNSILNCFLLLFANLNKPKTVLACDNSFLWSNVLHPNYVPTLLKSLSPYNNSITDSDQFKPAWHLSAKNTIIHLCHAEYMFL